ncbi:hypothetical protein GLAREA_04103 [Glarea lozoyensis ATCC 20868]|uniref:Uncharacterized protein n=1 Tax=Glarea lozoyensis (strain ATCC 20868 / MF5171) TaxID=1116229 RepID=S3DGH6_GLAL2|nr:uncharacterized protein GLAREA_04103 [Glarea lozoyensis ATCC 20868]EPE31136.1 hypothetical protein GLAREA_04103 [Glarea lozoyensis ATCC 20868]
MSNIPLSVFMNGYLDPAQVVLGRLVLDMKNPGQNFCPHGELQLRKDVDFSKAPFSNLKSLANAESPSHFKGALSKILNVFAERSRTSVDDISTSAATRYQLLNVNIQFESIFNNDEGKKWLEKVILTGSEVYMVVGLHTLQDASIGLDCAASSEAGATLQAPIADSLLPGASAIPGAALDAKFEGGVNSKSSLGASFVAPGERIIAVQYQRVKFQMSSSKSPKGIADAILDKKTVWKSFGSARGGADLDTFEATLVEKMTEDDIGEDVEVEGTCADNGQVFAILL